MDTAFYDQLAPLYHLIHQDWEASIARQGLQLSALLSEWPPGSAVLDVACGIGTQALALAERGYRATASDLSPVAVERAKRESQHRGLEIQFSLCDMREAHAHHGGKFAALVCADNSLPHLLTNADISRALAQFHACLRPGGACLITVRDYDAEPRGRNIVKPYGVRIEASKRYLLFQVWDFEQSLCNITFYFVEEDLATGAVQTRALRSKYYALSVSMLMELMRAAGFERIRRIDDGFYQPVIMGIRPRTRC